jgi:hypothetical protein
MEAVTQLMHVGVELMSRLARAMRDALAELGRAVLNGLAEVAGTATHGRDRGPRWRRARLRRQNWCGHGE